MFSIWIKIELKKSLAFWTLSVQTAPAKEKSMDHPHIWIVIDGCTNTLVSLQFLCVCVSITGVGLAPSSCTMTDSVRMNSYPAGQQQILVGHFECHSEGYFDFDFYCSVKIEGRVSIRQANVEVFALDILPKNSWRNNNNLCFWILLLFFLSTVLIFICDQFL